MMSGCQKQWVVVCLAVLIAGGSMSPTATLSGAETVDPEVVQPEQLVALISAGRYAQAVDLYSELYDELSEVESQPYRDRIFAFAEERYAAEDYQAVSTLMEHYLAIFYRDLRALNLLADSEHGLKLYADEIDTLFAALEASHLQ